jgi:glycosyltransferase involved in cell wall biosynthesis
MRAAFYVDSPHRLAGSQRSLLAALGRVHEHGVEPVVVVPGTGLFVDACRTRGIEVSVLPGSEAYQSFGRALLRMGPARQAAVMAREVLPYSVRFAALLDRLRAEVVHFNTGRGAIMAGVGAHFARREVVLHVRGTPGVGGRYWAAAQAVAGRFILVAEALRVHLFPSARRRASVVYNGVDVPPPFERGGSRLALVDHGIPRSWVDGRATIFLCLASLVPFKGVHHLLEAFRRATSDLPDAKLLIAGAGLGDDYETWLTRLPAQLGLQDRVALLGFVPNPAALLAGSDALVLPSVEKETLQLPERQVQVLGNEGLPRSVLEAMAFGLPVIATDVAGVREQVEDEVTGVVVPPGDEGSLADALVRVGTDEPWRRSAGVAAVRRVEDRFSVERAAFGLAQQLTAASAGQRGASARVSDAFETFKDFAHVARAV